MRYDLHIHTKYSLCSNLKPAKVLKIAKKKGLDGIAITDHNEIDGAFHVKRLNKDKDFEVIIGTEVKTNKGDVLAYNVNQKIRSKELLEVLDEIKQQGALAVVAHPYRALPHLRFRYSLDKIKNKISGIETFNARSSFLANKFALNTCNRLNLAQTGGSDSHFAYEIGRAFTIFEGSLEKAIKTRSTKVDGITFGSFLGGAMSSLLRGKRRTFNRRYVDKVHKKLK